MILTKNLSLSRYCLFQKGETDIRLLLISLTTIIATPLNLYLGSQYVLERQGKMEYEV